LGDQPLAILTRVAIVLVASVLACASMTAPLHAQSPAPYCAQFSDGTSPSCTFATLQQCNASISGVGGVCNLNPAAPYQAAPPARYQYQYQQPFNPMAMPPPPPGGM
jgi:Protein of unknown function (DUF3551)